MKNSSFACFAPAIFISVHFTAILVLSAMWNDPFCSCEDNVSIWWQIFIIFLFSPNCWYQLNFRIFRIHFACTMTWDDYWEIISQMQSYVFLMMFLLLPVSYLLKLAIKIKRRQCGSSCSGAGLQIWRSWVLLLPRAGFVSGSLWFNSSAAILLYKANWSTSCQLGFLTCYVSFIDPQKPQKKNYIEKLWDNKVPTGALLLVLANYFWTEIKTIFLLNNIHLWSKQMWIAA